jgi:hypothetical protein
VTEPPDWNQNPPGAYNSLKLFGAGGFCLVFGAVRRVGSRNLTDHHNRSIIAASGEARRMAVRCRAGVSP